MPGRGQLLWVRVLLHCWWFSGRLQLRWRWLANAHMHSGSPDAVVSATLAAATIAIAATAIAAIAIAATTYASTTVAASVAAACNTSRSNHPSQPRGNLHRHIPSASAPRQQQHVSSAAAASGAASLPRGGRDSVHLPRPDRGESGLGRGWCCGGDGATPPARHEHPRARGRPRTRAGVAAFARARPEPCADDSALAAAAASSIAVLGPSPGAPSLCLTLRRGTAACTEGVPKQPWPLPLPPLASHGPLRDATSSDPSTLPSAGPSLGRASHTPCPLHSPWLHRSTVTRDPSLCTGIRVATGHPTLVGLGGAVRYRGTACWLLLDLRLCCDALEETAAQQAFGIEGV